MLLEAQSSWTVNILIRILLYLAQSYHEYFERTSQSLYKSKKVKMPKPELYIIYTGNKGRKPDIISLSKEFFDGADIDIEIKAKVIYESNKDNIINEYIIFCKIFNEQVKAHGMTKRAVTETIRICKDKDVLKEYLSAHEKEVVSIMMALFSQEKAVEQFGYEKKQEGREEGDLKRAMRTASNMFKDGEPIDKIARFLEFSPETILSWVEKV